MRKMTWDEWNGCDYEEDYEGDKKMKYKLTMKETKNIYKSFDDCRTTEDWLEDQEFANLHECKGLANEYGALSDMLEDIQNGILDTKTIKCNDGEIVIIKREDFTTWLGY